MSGCPTCGHQIDSELPVSALEAICLSKQLRRILNVFVSRFGKPVDTAEIVEALYFDDPNGGPENACNVVNVRMMELRKRLRPVGFEIEGKMGRQGRRLVRIEDPCGSAAA